MGCPHLLRTSYRKTDCQVTRAMYCAPLRGQHRCTPKQAHLVASQQGKTAEEWGDPHYGELSEGVGGTFGGRALCNTTPHQELLDCTHSEAQNFKGDWEGGGDANWCVNSARQRRTDRARAYCAPAFRSGGGRTAFNAKHNQCRATGGPVDGMMWRNHH